MILKERWIGSAYIEFDCGCNMEVTCISNDDNTILFDCYTEYEVSDFLPCKRHESLVGDRRLEGVAAQVVDKWVEEHDVDLKTVFCEYDRIKGADSSLLDALLKNE